MANNYDSGVWGTYRQWQEKGAQVRKGETSSMVVFYSEEKNKKGKDKDDDERKMFIARSFRVFNSEQVEGYENRVLAVADVDEFVQGTGVDLRHGKAQSFYSIEGDFVNMPAKSRFIGTQTSDETESYYSTLFHELVHWTGRAGRWSVW